MAIRVGVFNWKTKKPLQDVKVAELDANGNILSEAQTNSSGIASITPTTEPFIPYVMLSRTEQPHIEVVVLSGDRDLSELDELAKAFHGISLETFSFTEASNGTVVTGSLEQTGGGDLTMFFSSGFATFDCTPAATVTLTPGTDTAPQKNYVYILQSDQTQMTVSPSDWPTTEHLKIAEVILQSAATTQTNGALALRQWNDHVSSPDDQGHIPHVTERLRWEHSAWRDGVVPTWTITTNGGAIDNIDVSVTAGRVYQMHLQATAAKNTATGDTVNVVNDFTTPYLATSDLEDLLTDSAGVSMTGRYYNLVLWKSVSSVGSEEHMFINLPSGSYNKLSDAIADVSSFTNFSIPIEFRGYAFLVSRITLRHQAAASGTFTSEQETDLRGQVPNIVAGGGSPTHARDIIEDLTNQHVEVKGNVIEFGSLIDTHQFMTVVGVDFKDVLGATILSFKPTNVTIERDLNLNGVIAIGTAAIEPITPGGAAGTAINVDQLVTPISGTSRIFRANYSYGPGVAGLTARALDATIFTAGSTNINEIYGVNFSTQHQGSGALTNLYGSRFGASTGGLGTIGILYGNRLDVALSHATTLTFAFGQRIVIGIAGGVTVPELYGIDITFEGSFTATLTNLYQLSLNAIPTPSGSPSIYAIRQADGNDVAINWMQSPTRVGGTQFASVGSGTSQFEALSTTKDLLFPRMTTAQVSTWLATNPQSGGTVYDTGRDALRVQETVNGVRRALAQRSNWYNVLDFGAVGDDATDDTTAIQATIDAANAIGGGVVYFPEAIYKTKTRLNLSSNVQLHGEGYGSIIRLDPDVNTTEIDCIRTVVDSLHWKIDNLHLQMGAVWTDANAAGAMIRVRNSRVSQISNIWIDGVGELDRCRWGIYVDDDFDDDDIRDGDNASHFLMYGPIHMLEGISSQADSAAIRIKAAFGGWGHYFLGGGTVQTYRHSPTTTLGTPVAYSPEGDKGLWIEAVDGFRMVGYEVIDFKRCLVVGEQTASANGINSFGPVHVRLTDCAFEAIGTLAQDGGAVWSDMGSNVMFENCTLYGQDAAATWEVYLDKIVQSWFFSNCDIGIRADSAGSVRLQNTDDSASYLVRFSNVVFGRADISLQIDQDANNVVVANSNMAGAVDGVRVTGTHAVNLKVSQTAITSPTPLVWTNTGSRHLVHFSGMTPESLNTDGTGYDTCWIEDDFNSGSIETGEVGRLGWNWSGGTLSYIIGEGASHPGVIARTTPDNDNTTWCEMSLQTPQGFAIEPAFHLDSYFDSLFLVKPGSGETANVDVRVGLHLIAAATAAGPRGVYFERLAANANWQAVTQDGGGQATTDTGITFTGGNWYRLEIRRISATQVEFLINGASVAIHNTRIESLTEAPFMHHRNTVAAEGSDKSMIFDLFSTRIPILGR